LNINLTTVLQELGVRRKLDIGPIRVIHGLEEVPFILSFSREVKIDDLEGALDNWELSEEIISEKSEVLFKDPTPSNLGEGLLKRCIIYSNLIKRS